MESIQPYLDYFSANPQWALIIIFLIAFGEALLIIGLFVPSTAVLVGAGMLVGTGHLEFWPVFAATALGCILGDQVSYWAGRMFGDRLKQLWPLNKYQSLVMKGEEFVRNHGGKSIALGRFVPGVKAVVPGIVGMLGMNQPFFIAVNVSSGLFWAIAHILPGMLLGHGLALAGDVSGRLVIVILVLLVLLGVIGWLTRLLAAGLLSPFTQRVLSNVSRWLKTLGSRPFHRLGRRIAPGHPSSARLLSFGLLAFVCLGLLLNLLYGISHRDSASSIDLSVRTLMLELRNAPGDELMVALTMLGDWWVLLAMCAVMMLWLAVRRAWPAVFGIAAAIIAQIILTSIMKMAVARPRPPGLDPSAFDTMGSFPSGYAAFSTLAFGLLAVIAGQALGRWSRATLLSFVCMIVVTIAFSRVYLGAHWLSDVLGGIMLALIPVAALAFVLEAYPVRRLMPLRFISVALATLVIAWSADLMFTHEGRAERYAKINPVEQFSLAAWRDGAWKQAPARRIDLTGRREDIFVAQWIGPLERLRDVTAAGGYVPHDTWGWSEALNYFDPSASFDRVPPRPLLHEGLRAKLTALRQDPADAGRRYVLRVYRSADSVDAGGGTRLPVYLVSLMLEQNQPRFGLYTMPKTSPVPEDVAADLLAKLRAAGSDVQPAGEPPLAVILAQPQG